MNPSGRLAVFRIVLEHTVHLFVDHVVDRGAVIEFGTDLMGSGNESGHVVDGGNLGCRELRHEEILQFVLGWAWVGACRAGANNCGGQHRRGAGESACKGGNAGAHGRISVSSGPSAQ
nr:hypothetical protein [Mycobacterium sp. Marseille-P9652]